MKRVLVCGGAGYVGTTLVPVLLDAGYAVTVFDRFYFGQAGLAPLAAEHGAALRLVRGDVRRIEAEHLEGCDAVVDLAGISNDPSCDLDPGLTRAINYEGAVRIAHLAHVAGVERLVFASSCSVYGSGSDLALSEDAELNPVSLYARCKIDAERELQELGAESDLCVTPLRFATVFGLSGRMRFDLAINLMTRCAYVDGRIQVHGGGQQWRPFVHVRDVAQAIQRSLEAPVSRVRSRVFNVGSSGCNFQMRNLAFRIRDLVPDTEVDVVPSDPDRRSYNVDFSRIAGELDFKATRGLEDGVLEIREALASGGLDPDDRRWYTLKQYGFLAEAERLHGELAMNGCILGDPGA